MIEIITEIGWNHMGNMSLAKQMIKAAKDNGADYAKFQTWSVKRLKTGEWDTDGRREIYEKAELSYTNHEMLKNYCDEIGIHFLSSVFSLKDAKLYNKVQPKFVKIPSFESRNRELISYCRDNFETVFISTGTSTFDEISQTIDLFPLNIRSNRLVLLHCVSAYPLNPEDANIKRLNCLRARFGLIDDHTRFGYSDHMEGVESAKVAIELGVKVIEKHFTIDKNLPGRDNRFACLPEDIKNLRDYIILREKMLSKMEKDFLEIEKNSRENYTGRFNK